MGRGFWHEPPPTLRIARLLNESHLARPIGRLSALVAMPFLRGQPADGRLMQTQVSGEAPSPDTGRLLPLPLLDPLREHASCRPGQPSGRCRLLSTT